MNASQISQKDFSRLTSLQEGVLSGEEFDRLEADLRERPELRQEWIRLQDLDGELGRYFEEHAEKSKSGRNRIISFLALAAAVMLGAFLTSFFDFRSTPDASYVSVGLQGLEPVAMITRLESIEGGDDFHLGATLEPGTIHLEKGELELTFFCGASLQLEGPAELELLTQYQAYLVRGKAAARVPKEAIGFTVKTPEAAVVDLGTEFAVAVDDSGDSQVHVYDGEVRVSLLGEDGSTLSSSPVLTGGSLEVEPGEQELRYVKKSRALPRVLATRQDSLPVPKSYVEDVKASQPLVYWRFDGDTGRKIHDYSGNGWDGTMHGDVAVEDGVLLFEESSQANSYVKSESLPNLNQGPYSVELWVNPQRYHYATLVALHSTLKAPGKERPHHLSVMELMTRSHLVHRPGSIRFLHRWKEAEVNAFSDKPFLPGHWHHIVGVRDTEEVRLYVNGELVRTIHKEGESNTSSYQVVLGKIDDVRALRQFQGILDEFAIYPRALSVAEVQSHYQSMNFSEK